MRLVELQDRIYQLVNGWIGGATLFWAEQSQPRPTKPYVTLKVITGMVRVGDDDFLRRDQITTLTLSDDLEAGDTVTGKVGDRNIEVDFTGSHAETLRLLCTQIRKDRVYYAKVDRVNNRLIRVRSFDDFTFADWEISDEEKEIAVEEIRDSDGAMISGMRRATVSMNVYGGSVSQTGVVTTAMDILERFHTVMQLPSFLDDAKQLELGVVGAEAPQNLTEAIETAYEDRAHMDFILHVPVEFDAGDVGFIESIDLKRG